MKRKITVLVCCSCFLIQTVQAQNTSWNTSGNIGIGTTSPGVPLDVVGNMRATGVIGETLWTGYGEHGMIRKLNANIPLRFLTSIGTEEMRIHSNGNVGIGTTNPDSKLAVAGKIHAEEVKISVAVGADFVFDEDYQLLPLAQIEAYIKENKRLPNIKSATEMIDKGLELGEMNIRLLEKIEELTLHLIKMNKLLEQNAQQNLKQQEEIERLNSLVRRN